MITKKTIVTFCILVILSLLLSSCGASHQLTDESRYQADDFRYNNLKSNELVIGGISSLNVEISREDRIQYSSMLSNLVLEQLTDVHTIKLVNTMQMVNKVGKQNYFEIMDIFDKGIIASERDMNLITSSLPQSKYFMVAHIENENIIDRSSEKYIEQKNDEKKRETTYKKTYLLTIDFQIYDLKQKKLVWSNVIYNQAYRSEKRTTSTGCVEGCAESLFSTILMGSPAEISREEVFAIMIEKFVENLTHS